MLGFVIQYKTKWLMERNVMDTQKVCGKILTFLQNHVTFFF